MNYFRFYIQYLDKENREFMESKMYSQKHMPINWYTPGFIERLDRDRLIDLTEFINTGTNIFVEVLDVIYFYTYNKGYDEK